MYHDDKIRHLVAVAIGENEIADVDGGLKSFSDETTKKPFLPIVMFVFDEIDPLISNIDTSLRCK